MADVAVNTLPTEASPIVADTVLTVKSADGSLVRVALSGIKTLFDIPSTAADVGAIPAPSSPATGAFLVWDGSAWVAEDTPTEVFWATYGTTTSAQIEAAYQAGKVCVCVYNNRLYFLTDIQSSTYHLFTAGTSTRLYNVYCNNDTWSNGTRLIPGASSDTPSPLGTAAAGSGTTYARGDHVHAMPSASDVGAVAVAQGVGHAGEFLVVGSDGDVTTVTLSTWQGGSY